MSTHSKKPPLSGLLIIGLIIFVLLLAKAFLYKKLQSDLADEVEAQQLRAEQREQAAESEQANDSDVPLQTEGNDNQQHSGETSEPGS